jgi:serine-type D-Ala-D-Ala carboxypeptidase (penicillin-binding protein 5/6)
MLFNLHNLYAKIIVFFGAIFVIVIMVISIGDNQNNDLVYVEEEIIYKHNYFEDISLEAKAVFVWNVNRREVMYALNEEAQLPLASLTKLMTAITASDILPEASIITINKDALEEEGDSGLLENEKWSFKDLLRFTLMISSNDGASAVASVAGLFKSDFPVKAESKKSFVRSMNEKTKEIGLTQTYFINPTGLDNSEAVGGGYGSARDVANLLEYAIINNPEIIEDTREVEIKFTSLSNIDHIATNTNSVVDSLPGLIASKTGFTDLAGGNLVIAFDAGLNHPIIISVLGSTQEGRFRDVEKLVAVSLKSL